MPQRRLPRALVRPQSLLLAATGAFGSVLLLVTAGRTIVDVNTMPASRWFGLVVMPDSAWGDGLIALAEVVGVLLLIGSWIALLRLARSREFGIRTVSAIAGAWAVPLAVGPPLFSLDAYSYLAQGHLQQVGLDPYRVGPVALGAGPFLDAVDPRWAAAPTPYGPLGVLAERLCALAGPTGGLVVLHLLSLLAVAGCGLFLAMLVRPSRRPYAVAMGVANPLVLTQIVGAGHWESLICLTLLGSLVLWQRGHLLLAIAAASLSAAVKAPLLIAVVVFAGLYLVAQPTVRDRVRAGVGVVAATVAPWLLMALVQPHVLGFIAAMRSPLSSRTVYGPSTAVAELLRLLAQGLSVDVQFTDLLVVVQVVAIVAGAAVVASLVASSGRRPVANTVGLSLLVVVLVSPVVYPWYLLWAVLPLVVAGVGDRWLVRLSAFAPFTALPGCQYLTAFLPSGMATQAPWVFSTLAVSVAVVLLLRSRQVAEAAG